MAPEDDRSETDRTDDPDAEPTTVTRRSYVAIAGGAIASAMGWAGTGEGTAKSDAGGTTGGLDGGTAYGYGGATVATAAGVAAATTSVTESEPNDARDRATTVGTDIVVSGSLETAGVDWYAFDLAAGERQPVEIERASADGVVALVLYGPEGEHLDTRYVGSDAPARIDVDSAATAGTHYVEVVDVQRGDGDYRLTIGSPETTTSTPTPTPTSTSTPTPTPTPTSTPADDYGAQGYGQYGYGGVT
jgi:hypothetical protein